MGRPKTKFQVQLRLTGADRTALALALAAADHDVDDVLANLLEMTCHAIQRGERFRPPPHDRAEGSVLRFKLPLRLAQEVDAAAAVLGVTRSDLVRIALQHAQTFGNERLELERACAPDFAGDVSRASNAMLRLWLRHRCGSAPSSTGVLFEIVLPLQARLDAVVARIDALEQYVDALKNQGYRDTMQMSLPDLREEARRLGKKLPPGTSLGAARAIVTALHRKGN